MGYTVRVADARYTEWRAWRAGCVADWSPAGLVAAELYDHYGDDGVGAAAYDDFENVNLALEPAHATTVASHRALLEKRFKGTDSEAGCPADLGPDGEVLLPTHLEDEA